MSSAVSVRGGIRYGFSLIFYSLGVLVIGGGFVAAGAFLASENAAIAGAPLALLGLLIIYSGSLGLGYKVIADGVKTGTIQGNTEQSD